MFEARDVDRSFSSEVVVRGKKYLRQRMVLDAWRDIDGDIHGTVQGSDDEPYEVTIELVEKPRSRKLVSWCTCPYESQCKHAVAVALYSLDHELRVKDDEDLDEEADEALRRLIESASSEPNTPKYDPPRYFEPPKRQMSPHVWNWLGEVAAGIGDERVVQGDPAKGRVFYRFTLKDRGVIAMTPIVTPVIRKPLKSGQLSAAIEVKQSSISSYNKPLIWSRFDLAMIADLEANAAKADSYQPHYCLDGRHGLRLTEDLVASGQFYWGDIGLVKLGHTRSARFAWEIAKNKLSCSPKVEAPPYCAVLGMREPWYFDRSTAEIGPLDFGFDGKIVSFLTRLSSIPAEEVPMVRERLIGLGVPPELLPPEEIVVETLQVDPVPHLFVDFEVCARHDYWGKKAFSAPVAFARLDFYYGGHRGTVDGKDIRVVEDDKVRIYQRNLAAEHYAHQFLNQNGWSGTQYSGWNIPSGRGNQKCITCGVSNDAGHVLTLVESFTSSVVPLLEAAGWVMDIQEGYRIVPETEVSWDIGLESKSDIDWFEFRLGIEVAGQRVELKPILGDLFQQINGSSRGRQNSGDDDSIYVSSGERRLVKLSRARLTALLQPLIELFGGFEEWPDQLRLTKSALPLVDLFEESAVKANVPWKTTTELATLKNRFATFDRLEPMTEPPGFVGELRGYQREGLAWLQFLREFRFGGVLADDMGLGKTVQILAHVQMEKNAGRLDKPCLIVAPTSTIPNWRRECVKFTPDLTVTVLHGNSRASRFSDLSKADIALTTYPLLARDKAPLSGADYHLLILDEAQNVKNASTAAAKAVRELSASHRICLSGTPVENHLGELWSLFHFLMPGFLGSDAEFKKRFRNPIEKFADVSARVSLARRVRPFMLRRTKSQVAQELPEKTEAVETIEFEDAQKDLYESIRASMDEQVRRLIAEQGFDRSRIQILDALLKLRQVCCDPRLVKLPSARAVAQSAKLDRLMEMMGVLLEEGRRVLLFSQFTSMLDLIEERLRPSGVNWVRISGDTSDRDTPVREFQEGRVPLFLISLKAGGTGLNLTAADTVILYDPWWNPAVENQAIDRAHRIGQTKPVMIYKLVAAGTIEEKMLELQARKGDLARSILTDDADGIRSLTAEDLRWVLSTDA